MDPLSLILSLVLPLVPEPHRTYLHAAIVAWLYVTTVASIATAKLPAWAFKRWRVLRVLSWLSVLAPRDGAGTVKLPFTTPQAPGVLADLARFRAGAERIADAAAPLIPGAPPSDGQRGAVRVELLVLVACGAMILAGIARELGVVAALGVVCLCVAAAVAWIARARRVAPLRYPEPPAPRAALALVVLVGALGLRCTPTPTPIDGGPAVTPSSWTATARVVLTTLRWAVPAARVITDLTVAEPGRTQVARALDATTQAAERFQSAVDAYERAGGDRCAARAAVAGLHSALVVVAQTLADNGIALGTTLERVVDGVASIADALIPACDADAGWASAASAGDASNATLRAIAARAGRPLSRVLDDLRPVDGGVR